MFFHVLLNGETTLKGLWANGPAVAIAYPLVEKNVFIVSTVGSNIMKMVKIRVTGETTFDWLEAKYHQDYPYECGKQSTFSENCFTGTSVDQDKYDVNLKAVLRDYGILYKDHVYLVSATKLTKNNSNLILNIGFIFRSMHSIFRKNMP